MDKVVKLADKLGVQEIQFYPFKVAGNAVREIKHLQIRPDDWQEVYEKLFAAAEKYSNIIMDFGLDNNPIIAGYLGKISLPCPCGRYSIVVRPSGDVTACGLAVKVIGNVHRQSLVDIWRNSPELLLIRQGKKSPCELFCESFAGT